MTRYEKECRIKNAVVSLAGLCLLICSLHAGQEGLPNAIQGVWGPQPPGQYLSPHALVAGKGNILYVAAATTEKLILFDAAAEKVIDVVPLLCLPSGMALSPDGRRLYITADAPSGEVYVMDTATHRASLFAQVGHTPNAPVLSPDGKTL